MNIARFQSAPGLAGAALAVVQLATPAAAATTPPAPVTVITPAAAEPKPADSAAATGNATVSGAANSSPASFPPLQYAGTVAGDELYTLIKANPRFAKLDKELVGSPVSLRVTQSFALSSGGKATGLASAILAGGTLGLLPVVTNGDLVITYEMVVNGTVLSTYAYQKNFTRSQNIYSTDTTYGLGKDGLAWTRTTVEQFLADAAKDPKLDALLAEYQFYFGTAAK